MIVASGLGDVACTPEEARAGESAVGEMNQIFVAAGSPSRFKPQVDAINEEFKRYKSWAPSIRFQTSIWCDAKALGVRAKALSDVIARAAGFAATIEDPRLRAGASEQLFTGLKWIGGLAAIGVLLWGGAQVYAATRARKFALRGAR